MNKLILTIKKIITMARKCLGILDKDGNPLVDGFQVKSTADVTGLDTALAGKISKVANATANNFAKLNADGTIADSGKKASDFANESHNHEQSDITDLTASLAGKADKVASATNNNFASLDANGNIKDSGKKSSDFANSIHSHTQLGSVDGVIVVGIEQQQGEEDLTMIQLDSDVVKGDAVRTDIDDVEDGERKLLTSGAVKSALSGKADSAHTHSTSESWLSNALSGKADSAHTHSTSESWLSNALSGKAETNHTHSTSESWLSNALAAKANTTSPEFTGQVGVDDEVYGSGDTGLTLAGGSETTGGYIWLQPNGSGEYQGGIDFNGRSVGGSAVVTSGQMSAANANKLVTSGVIQTALAAKADASSVPTKTSDLTNDSGFLTSHQDITGKEDKSNKVLSTTGDLNEDSTDTQYPSAKLVFERACGTTAITIENSTTLDLETMKEGQAYLLEQYSLSTKRQLQSIIPSTPNGNRRLCGNATLAKDYMLIRMFHRNDQYIVVVLASFDTNEYL